MSSNLILLPRIRVQNANALSSPFTIGFPAMTAWLGGVHALQRKLNTNNITVIFSAVGVVVHRFDLQIYKGPGDFVHSIVGTGNPLEPKSEKDKPKGNAVRPSFIEEPRCHLEVSLLVEYSGIEAQDEQLMLERIYQLMLGNMKLAGGDILNCKEPEILRDFQKAKRKLMPGYALIERRDLMQAAMEQGQDAMDAMLDYVAVHYSCTKEIVNGQERVIWQRKRKSTGLDDQTGWIVPIATGFHGISELGTAINQRHPDTPHLFAESVVTLGEFKMPYRLESPDDLLWRYHVESENNLYLCIQQKSISETSNDDY
ncbi:TPA: type I-F CRISPR-associated protein Csy2 [Legionella pneumophila]|uniref:type I-F CRISPR-associated protein Csy2 n=1 Tax=Legionella pneumophila TaxID=446 RepID=UPI0013752FFB|nr:type I-F CRISPR-associated protein Csy2 [Legionella pneumophila]HAT2148191.1 type I-F CRISPR-associated protein Csy2 [Legionella pneumophila]HAT2151388.1 type I-F CRISPR-associated protein Csy2 [Legionella pneumophila]HAT7923516.1 type I-F CRISPR-associated protein Csy2 [Legionella pneumophila]HAT8311083.1 type I-F CRISPR-associated protein Csy2 [Legionella pneumophila]HAT8731118.1 type I-F CRISPR-associated protein Csy2 [Legionella pneumophila]